MYSDRGVGDRQVWAPVQIRSSVGRRLAAHSSRARGLI